MCVFCPFTSWGSALTREKQCGKVREVKITELPNALVATVEFFERVCYLSIPFYTFIQHIGITGQYTCCADQRQEKSAWPGGRRPPCMEIDAICDQFPRIG